MSIAEHMTTEERKHARLLAYSSTWSGCFADVMMENSAIIILFIAMLGGSPTLAMFSTSMNGIVSLLFMFPAAGIGKRLGPKRVVALSCLIAFVSYLLIASAPLWGDKLDKYIVLVGCFTFCVSKPLWTAGWYYIMSDILLPEERGSFLGFMRFSYYVLTGSVFFLIGLVMGDTPSIHFMQAIIGVTAILTLGRTWAISSIRLSTPQTKDTSFGKELAIAVKNGPLISFSIYICVVCLAFAPVLPLTLIYLKDQLNCADDVVQIVSTVGIAGNILGFFLYGYIQRWFGMKIFQIFAHLLYIVVPLCIAFFGESSPQHIFMISALTFLGSFAFAGFLCIVSQETLALSRPGNITMATALSQSYYMLGTAVGRVGTSVLLGSGVLSLTWKYWDFTFCNYQTIFMICAGISFIGLILLPSLPSLVPKRDDWYHP